ncbi:CfaE/CblD family pilus tip adhesin [Alcaligenaceae bacterium A4P071]|nr:CfaE/CblD family pilus tip adhesin [Alcaligenaceae bacterium A4P071]
MVARDLESKMSMAGGAVARTYRVICGGRLRLRQIFSRLAVLVSVVLLSPAHATTPVYPASNHQSVSLAFERNRPPPDYYVWRQALGAYTPSGDNTYERITWTCLARRDSRTGACDVNPVWAIGGVDARIPLRFTERRSALHLDLTLKALSEHYVVPNVCTRYIGRMHIGAVTSGMFNHDCHGFMTGPGRGKALTLYLPQDEMRKIPSGGIWEAKLHLNMRAYGGGYPILATYTADFVLTVTDKGAIEAYLPAFGNAAPLVDLNLRTLTLPNQPGGKVGGVANLDLCLYDGFNANSTWYDLRVSDLLSVPGRSPDKFSVLHTATGSDTSEAKRIDYGIEMTYNGARMRLENGRVEHLTGVDSGEIRAVRLPNIPFPVVCTPTPLTLLTPDFNQLSKTAGRYSGKLRLEFTPSSESL